MQGGCLLSSYCLGVRGCDHGVAEQSQLSELLAPLGLCIWDPSPLPPPLVWHSHAGLSMCEILVPCCLPARLDPSPGISMRGCCLLSSLCLTAGGCRRGQMAAAVYGTDQMARQEDIVNRLGLERHLKIAMAACYATFSCCRRSGLSMPDS